MVTDDDGCDGEANDGDQGDGGAHGDEEWDQNVGGCIDGEANGGGKGGDCNDGDDGGDSDDGGERDQDDGVYEDSDVTMRIVMMTMLMVAAKGIKMIVTVMMVTDEEVL